MSIISYLHIKNLYNKKKLLSFGVFLLTFCMLYPTATVYAFQNPLTKNQPIFEMLNMETLAEEKPKEKEIIIAVIDTGIDTNHDFLKPILWENYMEIAGNDKDDDKNGYIDDIYGWNFYNDNNSVCSYNEEGKASPKDNDNHGTHIAGIIASSIYTLFGTTVENYDIPIKIMPIKVTGGEYGTGKSTSLIKAIQYASKMGASICNISLNSSSYNDELYTTMLKSNMLFVCSAGNQVQNGTNIDENPTYPASFSLPNLISVTATDEQGEYAPYSNYGETSVHLAATGNRIYSSMVGNIYGSFTGTSMSTPFVTSTAASLMVTYPHLSPYDVKQILTHSVTEKQSLQGKVSSGGLLNIKDAFAYAKTYIPMEDITAPIINIKRKNSTITIQVTDDISSLRSISYLRGNRKLSDFTKEKKGKELSSLTLNLSKGTYTFYVCDFVGNEKIETITIP